MRSTLTMQRGFTLIELMFTIVVLAIFLALAMPSFAEFRERGATRGAAEQLLSNYAAARFEAVKRDRLVKIGFVRDAGGRMCVGTELAAAANDDTICDCFTPGACGISQFPGDQAEWRGARWLANPTMGDTDTDGAGVVVIDPKLGLLTETGDAGQLVVRSASDAIDYRLRVELSVLGRATACVPDGARLLPGYRSC